MTNENETPAESLYTRTYSVPATHAVLALALTPSADTLEAVRKVVAHELEEAYRAGQASSPSERYATLAAKLERERVLLRRAIGIVSDLQRLEGDIRAVLDAHASDRDVEPGGAELRAIDAGIRAERERCAKLIEALPEGLSLTHAGKAAIVGSIRKRP